MASEVIQHAERLKRLLNGDDGTLTQEVTNFLNKYAVPAAQPLVQASSRAFNDTDLYELLLDKGRDILPAEIFSRFMMFYATLDDTITIPLFNEFGGIAEILMTMDSKIDQPTVVAAGAQVLAVLAERDVNLRTEIGAGDGMGLLVEALEAHKDNPISSVALMAALTNMMYNHFENKGTFLQQNGLHILTEVLTRNSAADRVGVVIAALSLLRNLTNLDQVRSMEATKAVHLTRDLLPILNKFLEHEKIVQHGAWALLNLLHGSQQNKVILTDRGGLDFVKNAISVWQHVSPRVVEPACLIVQQLAKLAINRNALVDKGIVPLLVSIMEHNRSADGIVVLLPAAKSLYRLSFSARNRRVIGTSGAISHLLWPLNNALASPKLHRVIARALLKLCREDENKDVIRNEGGVGAIVTSMNYFRDNPSVTALMVRAMNCLFVKDGGSSASPSSPVKPSLPHARGASGSHGDSSDSDDSDGDTSPDNSGSDEETSPRSSSANQALDDLDKVAAAIMDQASSSSPTNSADSDDFETMDVNMLVETLVAPTPDITSGIKDEQLDKPAITVTEEDGETHPHHEQHAPALPVVTESDEAAAAAQKQKEEEEEEQNRVKAELERQEAEKAEAAARAEAQAAFAAEQEKLKREAEEKAKKEEEERQNKEQEELARKKAEADAAAAAKKKAEEDAAAAAAAKKKAEEDAAAAAAAKKKADEEAAAAAAAKKKAEEEAAAAAAKKKAEEEAAAAAAAKKKAEEEAAAAAAAAAKKKAEEEAAAAAAAKKKAEEEAAAAAAKKRAADEAEAKKKAEEEAAAKAEAERKRQEAEVAAAAAATKKAAEERAAVEAKKKAEEETARAQAEAKRRETEAQQTVQQRKTQQKQASASTPTPAATPAASTTSSLVKKAAFVAVGAVVVAAIAFMGLGKF